MAQSPGYLHLQLTCCQMGLVPLAIPWGKIKDNGLHPGFCGCEVGQLDIDNGVAICHFDASIYHQCVQQMTSGSAGVGAGVGAAMPVAMPVATGSVMPQAALTQQMAVIVPAGMVPGQQIMVQSPTGQQSMAIIPEGVSSGMTFHVEVATAPVVVVEPLRVIT